MTKYCDLKELVEKVCEMYSNVIKEEGELSDKYCEMKTKMESDEITHKEYVQLQLELKFLEEKINGKKYELKGVSDVRDMLLNL